MAYRIRQHRFEGGVRLYNLGDIHRGNFNCRTDAFHKAVNVIQKDNGAFWVSTGDLLEVDLKMGRNYDYRNRSLGEELEALTDELRPIASKCLGIVASNHHRRVDKATGLSLDKVIAKDLGLPFLGIVGLINVTCGRASYFVVLHHGVGSGTAGNKLNRAMRLVKLASGADIYMTGHTHTYNHQPFVQKVLDRKRNILTKITSHHVVTGHFIEYDDSYAEELMLEPMPVGSAFVDLKASSPGNTNQKKVTVGFYEG